MKKLTSYKESTISRAHLLLTAILLLLLLLAATTLLSYHTKRFTWSSTVSASPPSASPEEEEGCDLSRGDWVPDPDAPYYTNETCLTINDRQNCIKFGRPNREFLRWRWKPDGCDLPIFDPSSFLELVRGKSMAFVGDSLARNHMQSLLCLLSTVSKPMEIYNLQDGHFSRYIFPYYNFTLANFRTPFLVRADSTGSDEILDGAFHLHVDKPDTKWTAEIEPFDYVIISAGHWFFRPSYLYEKNKLVACYRCRNDSINPTSLEDVYRRAFRFAFAYLNGLANYKGVTFLRTFSPSHFENGEWNMGGDCLRTVPSRSDETKLEDYVYPPMYTTPIEEFKVAKEEARKKGLKYHLLDVTKAMLVRPDGHPSRYGHPENAPVTMYRDCAHWCLPGPIDNWNGFLLEILRRDRRRMTTKVAPMDEERERQ